MHRRQVTAYAFSFLLIGAIVGCDERTDATTGARQTGFPGQITAGGGTSGEVMAQSTQKSDARYATGTPGIPQGSGGNTGGAATGGTVVQQSTQKSDTGNTTGTPGIPQGSGGNTGGAATGGTVQQAGPGAEGSPSSSQAGQSATSR